MFYSFDRVEEGLCVFISDEGEVIVVNPDVVSLDLRPGDVAVFVDGIFYQHLEETVRRKRENKNRADSLFK